MFRNLGVTITTRNKEQKAILSGCTAAIPPGSMVCLMGPSGSGKSTLLDQVRLSCTLSDATLLSLHSVNHCKISSSLLNAAELTQEHRQDVR